MGIAQHTSFQIAKGEVRSRDMTILLGYVVFAIVFLLVIYLNFHDGWNCAWRFNTDDCVSLARTTSELSSAHAQSMRADLDTLRGIFAAAIRLSYENGQPRKRRFGDGNLTTHAGRIATDPRFFVANQCLLGRSLAIL